MGVYQCVVSVTPHLTPNDLNPFICYYITLSDYAFHFLNDTYKNKTAFRPSFVPKGTLSSILIVKLSNDTPAPHFEPTKDFQKLLNLSNMEIQQGTSHTQ